MTPQQQVMIVQWARQLEREYGGLTGSHIDAPSGMTLGEAFKMLADCSSALEETPTVRGAPER